MQNIRTDLAVEAHELSRREVKNATEIDGVISDVRTEDGITCLLYTSPSPRDGLLSRMPSSA